jgi:hypothetical protein
MIATKRRPSCLRLMSRIWSRNAMALWRSPQGNHFDRLDRAIWAILVAIAIVIAATYLLPR